MTRALMMRWALRRPAGRALVVAVIVLGLGWAAVLGTGIGAAQRAGAQDGPAAEDVTLSFKSEVDDVTADELTLTVLAALGDPRGWGRAGFTFTLDEGSEHEVVLVEPEAAEALCAPNDFDGALGCQSGSVIVLNAATWREPPAGWDDAEAFRRYLVNHEVGHLIGQFHPENRCPVADEPESVMAPQFDGLEGCRPNAWPLDFEVFAASARPVALAPAVGVEPETRVVNPGGQTTPTLPPAGEDDGGAQPGGAEADDETAATDPPPVEADGDTTHDSDRPVVLIVVGVLLVFALVALLAMWLRRRGGEAPFAGFGDEDGAFSDLGEGIAAETDGTVLDDEVVLTFGDTEFVPLGVDVGTPDPDEIPEVPVWTVRVSGAAHRSGQLCWLVPRRWDQSEEEALTDVLERLIASWSDDGNDDAAQPDLVGELLADFLRRHPHLVPADHEGLGFTAVSGDQVLAVALGAAEVIELRNGLAKPARRQGALRLRHTEESPLEVEVSVPAPAQPRARIVVARTEPS